MKNLIRLFAFIFFSTSLSLFAQEKADYSSYPGYANFGNLSSLEDGEMVTEILIEEKLLKMVSKFTKEDEELSNLISGLKLIKVNTFEVTSNNEGNLRSKAKDIDEELMSNNWDRIVKTRSKDEIANVYIKTKGEDEIVGLTVVSIDSGGEAAFVNIVGNINMDALGRLSEKFDIPGIDSLDN